MMISDFEELSHATIMHFSSKDVNKFIASLLAPRKPEVMSSDSDLITFRNARHVDDVRIELKQSKIAINGFGNLPKKR